MDNSKTLEEKNWSVKDFNYPVPVHAKNFGYSVGGFTVVGFLLLIVTGVIMALFFSPSVDNARQSVLNLISSPWGMWLRSFHRWLAETVTFLIILHISRIIFTGSYAGRRKWNWMFGIGLLIITFAFFFSGTAIKWDQEGYEAYQHSLESLELVPLIGEPIADFLTGGLAVIRLFATHVLILPILLFVCLVPHLALMKLNGLSPIPGKTSAKTIMFFDHINKIIGFSAAIFGLVAFLAAQFPVALNPGPYSGVEITKPPWIFYPIYQLEDWFGIIALVIFPIIVVAGLILLPFIDKNVENIKTRRIVVWSYLLLITIMILFIINVAVLPPVKHLGG
ncbi:MAG: cytochrome bc complex cytochrome b subunit [Flavobacteriaceae bacterium]|nr:cytochrome bc complex cytochrome b subunit [Flavobacteriaceae bacterium]